MKVCTKCKEEKDEADFGRAKAVEGGLYRQCKSCVKKRAADYHAKNKDKITAYQAKYRSENKEAIAEYQALYSSKNKEKISKKNARYNANNKERISKQRAEYRELNRKKLSENSANYRKENPNIAIQWRLNNKDARAIYRAKYNTDNPEIAFWRNAVRRAWKGNKSSFDIVGLTSEAAKRVWRDKMSIALKYYPGVELHHDHMHPLAGAKSAEEGRDLNHFTNFVFIPSVDNLIKGSLPFEEWFDSLTDDNLIDCVTEQIAYNDSVAKNQS